MSDELTTTDPNLENPYSTNAEEQTAVKEYRGRFVHQIPTTDFFNDGTNNTPYQNEVSVDGDGFLGFWNVDEQGNKTFVSKSKLILDQVKNIVNTGILDKVVGINNNLEFYHAYRAGSNVFPNSSLRFPNSYAFFSVHAAGVDTSILRNTITNPPVQATANGLLPTTVVDQSDPNSFRYLPDFVVLNDGALSNGTMVTVKFYRNETDNVVIAQKEMEIRVSSTVSTQASTALPLYLRITGTNAGTIKMKANGDYDLVIPKGTEAQSVKFYGVVYYSEPGSNVATYYSRPLVSEGTIEDNGTVTVKYTETGSNITVSRHVTVHVIENPTLTNIFVTSWYDGTEFVPDSPISCKYKIFGTIDSGDSTAIYDVTESVEVVADKQGFSFSPATRSYEIAKAVLENRAEAYSNLTISSNVWNVGQSGSKRSFLHIPTTAEITSNIVKSIHSKRNCSSSTTETDFVDYIEISKPTGESNTYTVNLRYSGIEGVGNQVEKLVKVINGGDVNPDGTSDTIKAFKMVFWNGNADLSVTDLIITGELNSNNCSTEHGTIQFQLSVDDITKLNTLIDGPSTRVLASFRIGNLERSIYSVNVKK